MFRDGSQRVLPSTQYADATQEIKKAKDEARAENLLLKAEKFATAAFLIGTEKRKVN